MEEFHRQLEDSEFLKDFESNQILPQHFTHEAHIRLAWIIIQLDGIEKAKIKIPKLIQTYVAHVGVQDKYHETLTVALIQIVHHFIKKVPELSFEAFLQKNSRLKYQFKSLIDSHYSPFIWHDKRAKLRYFAPDKTAF